MGLYVDWLTIDSPDPARLAKFWCAALDYEVLYDTEEEEQAAAAGEPPAWEGDDTVEVLIGGQGRPRMLLLEVHDDKKVKNRLHLDLRPDDQDAEVTRLLSLGATKVDIGQGDVSWVVLADPDGNEFCVLRAPTEEEWAERKEREAAGKW